jgi:predicted HNH restriction endonuclease
VPTAREIPLEFHHIQPQARARDGKLPDGTLVHSASNQALLCSACHDAVHRGDLTIDGYRDTLHGNELVVRRPS